MRESSAKEFIWGYSWIRVSGSNEANRIGDPLLHNWQAICNQLLAKKTPIHFPHNQITNTADRTLSCTNTEDGMIAHNPSLCSASRRITPSSVGNKRRQLHCNYIISSSCSGSPWSTPSAMWIVMHRPKFITEELQATTTSIIFVYEDTWIALRRVKESLKTSAESVTELSR